MRHTDRERFQTRHETQKLSITWFKMRASWNCSEKNGLSCFFVVLFLPWQSFLLGASQHHSAEILSFLFLLHPSNIQNFISSRGNFQTDKINNYSRDVLKNLDCSWHLSFFFVWQVSLLYPFADCWCRSLLLSTHPLKEASLSILPHWLLFSPHLFLKSIDCCPIFLSISYCLYDWMT